MAIAPGLEMPTGAFVQGAHWPAMSRRSFTTMTPAMGDPLAGIAAKGTQVIRGPRMLRAGSVTVDSLGDVFSVFGARGSGGETLDPDTPLNSVWTDPADGACRAVV